MTTAANLQVVGGGRPASSFHRHVASRVLRLIKLRGGHQLNCHVEASGPEMVDHSMLADFFNEIGAADAPSPAA